MAQEEQQPDNTQTPEDNSPQLESGTYEIIRNRLKSFAGELRDRLNSLNGARKDVFGAIETTLLGTERVTTEHNCVPRDMIAIGERTGELERMLTSVADAYEEQVEATISAMTSLLAPLMILLMGGIIFVVAIGLLLPMMNMSKMVG